MLKTVLFYPNLEVCIGAEKAVKSLNILVQEQKKSHLCSHVLNSALNYVTQWKVTCVNDIVPFSHDPFVNENFTKHLSHLDKFMS